MFNYKGNLFLKNDGNPVKFVVLDSSLDKDIVSRLIMSGGGSVSINAKPVTNVINLSCKCLPWMKNYELFSTSYVYACCRRNEKLSLAGFSIGKTLSKEQLNELANHHLFLPLRCHSCASQNNKDFLEEYCDERDSHSDEVLDFSHIFTSLLNTYSERGYDEKVSSWILGHVNNGTKDNSLIVDACANCKETSTHSTFMKELTNEEQLFINQRNVVSEENTVVSEIYPNDSASMKREFINIASHPEYSENTSSCGSLPSVAEQEWHVCISKWLTR